MGPRPPASRLGAWLAATRPRTLPAGAAPVVVGAAFAYHEGPFTWLPALAALACALLLQVATNLANDYQDHRRGADTPDRLGPPRATASGWIAPRTVRAAALLTYGLAAVAGLYLVLRGGPLALAIGAASILAGYLYTGGPYPLGYHGWGDVMVFVFFGPVAVGGTYYVETLRLPTRDVLLAGAALGLLATAVLVVNNLRDRATDERAGKRTLAVLLGDAGARTEYVLALLAAYLVPLALAIPHRPAFLLAIVSAPVAALLALRVTRQRDPAGLNPYLGRTAQLLALFGLLLAAGALL